MAAHGQHLTCYETSNRAQEKTAWRAGSGACISLSLSRESLYGQASLKSIIELAERAVVKDCKVRTFWRTSAIEEETHWEFDV